MQECSVVTINFLSFFSLCSFFIFLIVSFCSFFSLPITFLCCNARSETSKLFSVMFFASTDLIIQFVQFNKLDSFVLRRNVRTNQLHLFVSFSFISMFYICEISFYRQGRFYDRKKKKEKEKMPKKEKWRKNENWKWEGVFESKGFMH